MDTTIVLLRIVNPTAVRKSAEGYGAGAAWDRSMRGGSR